MRFEPQTPERSSFIIERSKGSHSPAGARERDFSVSAASPEKDALGLPVQSMDVSKRIHAFGSPKRRALGPEHASRMQGNHAATGPMTSVRGVTMDLADLLVNREDTQDLDTSPCKSNADGTVWHAERDGSEVRSSVHERTIHEYPAEVPGDLYNLISQVDERLCVQLEDMAGRGFADEPAPSSSEKEEEESSSSSEDDYGFERLQYLPAPHAVPGPSLHFLVPPCGSTAQFSSDDGDPTRAFEPTRSSFEGHCSTAAAALCRMLSAGDSHAPGSPSASDTLQAFAPPPSATLRPLQLWGGMVRPSPVRSADGSDRLTRPSVRPSLHFPIPVY